MIAPFAFAQLFNARPMLMFNDIGTGEVRCLFSHSPLATTKELLTLSSSRPEGERTVVCEVDPNLLLAKVIDGFVSSLAQAALAVWPDWYDQSGLFARCSESTWQATLDQLASRRAASHHRTVLRAWLQVAAAKCSHGQPPIAADFLPAIQIQQLSLALADKELLIVIRSVDCEIPESGQLLGFSRGIEWLSQQVPARIVAVLPAAWHGRPELDSVTWNCQIVDSTPDRFESTATGDEPLLIVYPIRGRPHPKSPGEQLMASRLARDAELGPLFAYNMPIVSIRGNRYQVDLVWFDGKVVVEIDGYGYHSSRAEFASDRERDYELQLSGYMVLRLTHDCVIGDVELAIDKIRDFVRFRRQHPVS